MKRLVPKASTVTQRKTTYHVVAIELDGSFPRRNPAKPHIYLAISTVDGVGAIDRLGRGKGPSWVVGHAKRVRDDLVYQYKPTTSIETAKKRLKECRDQLARQGHAVNRDASRFSIYIVDLDPDIAPPMVNRGKLGKLVYVGQTSLTPEQRFAQHKGPAPRPGKRDLRSRIVNKRGVGLNYGLMKSLDTEAFSLEQAKERETNVSGLLERRGYRVFGDGATRYRASRRRPQDS